MSGGVPANTTTTTTVNQSPWQNPTYQALMLGTKDNPGPITNILRSNQGYMNAYNRMLGQGITPMDVVNSGKYNPTVGGAGSSFQTPTPTQSAASGGIMNVRGYASGGKPKAPQIPKNATAEQRLSAIQTAEQNGYKPKPAETRFMQTMADTQETIKGLGDIPYAVDPKTGAIKPVGRTSSQSSASYKEYLNKFAGAGGPLDAKLAKQYGAQNLAQQQKTAEDKKTSDAQQSILEQSLGQTAFVQKVKNPDGTYRLESTNPLFNQAVNRVLDAQKLPEQFGQATDAYKTGLAGLQGAAQYQARDVNAQRADVYGYDPAMAQASSYQAAMMNAPKDIQAQAYDAAQMNAAQAQAAQANRGDIRDIAAQMADVERYNAAQIERTQREQAATTQGPKSWTDPGVAQQYMNPYQQAVTDQELFEANRQAQMRENQQRSQATQQKAFGGTRAALQESEGRRNLGYLLSDIQAKGAQQAYQSGMGQFSAEQGLGAQVGMSNTQQINQLKQQYMQMGLSEAQANQAAINQASQINAAAQNTAYNNYVAQQLQAQQANQAMDWNTVNLNTSNQQATNMANAQFQQQAAQANQAAINQQRSQYVTQALQAAQNNYGGQLTAAQQNQVAQNAASQFNAGNQQQINLANQASQNAASQLYANAQNQAGLQYAQQNLQGQMANQQAGLQANQQNIGAWGQYLQGAGGLGALGASQASTNLANIGALGQAASAWQNLGQQYLNTQTDNARNTMNLPSTLYTPVVSMINNQPVQGGTTSQTGTSSPASWMGSKAKGGEVEAHKEWDKAKGGKTAKTGIASRGWN